MNDRRTYATPAMIGLLLLLLPSLYVGSYLALVEREWFGATYRVGGNAAAAIFAPANWVDRRLRPHVWEADFYGPPATTFD